MIRACIICIIVLLLLKKSRGDEKSPKDQAIDGGQAGLLVRQGTSIEPVNKSLIVDNIGTFLNGIGAVAVFDGLSEDDKNVRREIYDIFSLFRSPFEAIFIVTKNILKQKDRNLEQSYNQLLQRVFRSAYFLRAKINGTAGIEKQIVQTTYPSLSIPTVLDRINEVMTSADTLQKIGIRNIMKIEDLIRGLLALDVMAAGTDVLYQKMTGTKIDFESRIQFWVGKFQRNLHVRQ